MVNIKKVTASADAVLAGRRVVNKIILNGGSAASTVIVFDGATQASPGIDIGKLSSVIGDTKELDFGDEGYAFENGLSLTIAGTGAVVYIHY